MVRFTNRQSRDAVFAARKSLKNHQSRIFINEHLTNDAARIFMTARTLVKDKKLHSTWTQNGFVFVKLTDHPTARPQRVELLTDLPV